MVSLVVSCNSLNNSGEEVKNIKSLRTDRQSYLELLAQVRKKGEIMVSRHQNYTRK